MDENKLKRLRAAGLKAEADRAEHSFCPFCAKPVVAEDFRDALSRREFGISGLCQACQISFFGKGDDDE